MKTEALIDNISVEHGKWGEKIAAEYLRRCGFEIIDRNSRPCERDKRLEIDLVVWERKTDTMVFVEVKQHACEDLRYGRLRSVNRHKRENLRKAFDVWRRVYRWKGAYRFDVVEIYGVPEGGAPIVDHVENVELFPKSGRFVKWK